MTAVWRERGIATRIGRAEQPSHETAPSASDLWAFAPSYHPAGSDAELARVMPEVRAGRWRAMAELLAAGESRDQDRRTYRSQVLAALAVDSNVVELWLAEKPHQPDALMMAARVATTRAYRAARADVEWAWRLVDAAVRACLRAAEADSSDPVPWVCRIMLPREVHEFTDGPSEVPVRGPWSDLREALSRDGLNREALHRMMGALGPAHAREFAEWVVSHPGLPAGSALRLLPLYAMAESHAQAARLDPLADRRWAQARIEVDLAWSWFEHTDLDTAITADLSHVAHALWAAGRIEQAAHVFDAMGPFASQRPWSLIYGPDQATSQFVKARTHCLSVGPPSAGLPPRFYTHRAPLS